MSKDPKLNDILEGMSDIFFAVDQDWRLTHANQKFFEFTKSSPEQDLGKNLLQLYFNHPGAETSKYWVNYHHAMSDRTPVTFEDYYAPLDRWTQIHARPSAEGGLHIFARDITDRKSREWGAEELQFSKVQNEIIMNAVQVGRL